MDVIAKLSREKSSAWRFLESDIEDTIGVVAG
jgi:hypothetical protein